MKMRGSQGVLAAAALLAIAGCAARPAAVPAVQSGLDYAYLGPYVTAGATYALEQFDDVSGLDVDDSFGANARVGYRFHPHFGAELQGEYYDEFELESGGTEVGDVDGWSLSANAKGYLLRGPLQPYALAGVGFLSMEAEDSLGLGLSVDETEPMVRLGAGIDGYLSDQFLIEVEGAYVLPFGDLDDVDFLSLTLGVGFRF